MHILYLSQLIPYPADAGPKVRSYHVLQHLAAAGHQVTLLAFRRNNSRPEHVAHLEQYCNDVRTVLLRRSRARDAWHLARGLLTGQPFLIGRDSLAAMHRSLRALLAHHRFDAIHADQLWMAQYALAARGYDGQNGQLKTILDQHNAVYLIPRRMAAATANPIKRAILTLESRNLARYEVTTCQHFDHVVWVTEEDRQAVRGQWAVNSGQWTVNSNQWTVNSGQRAEGSGQWAVSSGQLLESRNRQQVFRDSVIPICVDPEAKRVIRRVERPRRVTFLGGLHWPPNAGGVLWFAREVWPKVRRQVPEAVFTVIGKNPPAELVAGAGPVENVEVTGYVSSLTPYLAETAVFVVPLHAGGGMRVKIIDAWSWGLPVVATAIGAEGIQYRDGENLLIADEAEAFAQAVVNLLKEPQMAAELGAAGRRTVEACYDWRKVYQAWDAIYPSA